MTTYSSKLSGDGHPTIPQSTLLNSKYLINTGVKKYGFLSPATLTFPQFKFLLFNFSSF